MHWNNKILSLANRFSKSITENVNSIQAPNKKENTAYIEYHDLALNLGALSFPKIGDCKTETYRTPHYHYADLTISNMEDGKTIELSMLINKHQRDGSLKVYKTQLSAIRASENDPNCNTMKIIGFTFENEKIDLNDSKRIHDILTSKLSNQIRSFPSVSHGVYNGIYVYAENPPLLKHIKNSLKKYL